MKAKTYNLAIDQRCTEKWDNMSASERGRYCSTCNKNVEDLTGLTPSEIIKLSSNSNLCGRMSSEQLGTYTVYEHKISFITRFRSVILGFFSLLSPLSYAAAQSQPEVVTIPKKNTEKKQSNDSDQEPTISGVLVDDKGNRLPFAFVSLKRGETTLKSAMSDDKGNFMLKLASTDLAGLTIEIDYVGYYRKTIPVHQAMINSPQKFKLREEAHFYLGYVVTTPAPERDEDGAIKKEKRFKLKSK